MIDGVIITPLKRIPDERGTIYHMLRSDAPHFKQFGEVYFTSAYPGVIKGWHKHTKMTLNYAVPLGMIKLVLYDDRPQSSTYKELQELFIGEDNYCLVTIPPMVWNGFKCIGSKPVLLSNCSTHAFEDGEMQRMDPLKNDLIPYSWDLVHK